MQRLARALMYGGAAGTVLGFGALHARYVGDYDFTDSYRFSWAIIFTALLCVASYGAGLPDVPRTMRARLASGGAASAAAAGAVSLIQLATGSAVLPRFVVFASAAVLVPWFALTARLAAGSRERRVERERVVVVAGEDDVATLREDLAGAERPATVVLSLSPEEARGTGARPAPLRDGALAAGATVVVLDRLAQAEEAVVAQAADLHERGVRVRTLSLFYDEWLGKLPLGELERMALMFDIQEVHSARYARVKRLVDIAFGITGLAAAAVVLPAVAVLNRIGNRGPLLYRQLRTGRNGHTFQILKLRTMTPGGGPTSWTTEEDPRITPVGRWLRRTHLDELPQVVNILRGDLTLVGPRPEQPHYVEELSEKIPFYRHRHMVRPGLTGWAQVRYAYGASERDAYEKLQYEFFYLRHQCLGLDVRIIGRTLRSVLGRGGR